MIMSIDEIVALLRKQADLRATENDERSILESAAEGIEEDMRELELDREQS
jgi:hypothetical protein